MRKIEFAEGEYYHILNRGVDKKNIFNNNNDYARFLFLILHCQSPITIADTSHATRDYLRSGIFNIDQPIFNKIIDQRYVELIAFSLMPNHYHLMILEKEEGGISRYMQRVQNAYTKYFNIKNEKTGHLFQGPFRAVHIADNEQLLYLSSYIHKNCCELNGWSNKPRKYPWSSFSDYTVENRWPKLLKSEIILDQFKSNNDYYKWAMESPAKDSNL